MRPELQDGVALISDASAYRHELLAWNVKTGEPPHDSPVSLFVIYSCRRLRVWLEQEGVLCGFQRAGINDYRSVAHDPPRIINSFGFLQNPAAVVWN